MDFAVGLSCFVRGARLARSRALRRFVWMPMAVSFVVIALLLVLGHAALEDVRAWLVARLPDWLDWLAHGLAPLFYLLAVVVGGWLFSFLAVLLASPFLGGLSARAEREAFGAGPDHDEGTGPAIQRTLAREARKIAYHLPRLALVFVFTLVPVVNVAAPLVWLAFGAWMLAVQFVDYAGENRGLDFRDTLALLRANRSAAFGPWRSGGAPARHPVRRPRRHSGRGVRRRPPVAAPRLTASAPGPDAKSMDIRSAAGAESVRAAVRRAARRHPLRRPALVNEAATKHTGPLGSTIHVIRADPDTVAALAAVEWHRHFRRVRLDPVKGIITLMAPSRLHEDLTEIVGQVVDAAASVLSGAARGIRSTRLRGQGEPPGTGMEPDGAFYVGERARGYFAACRKGDPEADDYVLRVAPDLVVETEITRFDEDKIERYADLGSTGAVAAARPPGQRRAAGGLPRPPCWLPAAPARRFPRA